VGGEPVTVGSEIRPYRADEQRRQPEHAEAESDVRGHAASSDFQVVDEEGQRDAVHLLGDELVDEPAREGHQVVGRNRPGDGYSHGRTLAGWIALRATAKPPEGRRAA
jgi:hypothetical protein